MLSQGGKCDEIRAMVRDPEKDNAKALLGNDKVTLVRGDFQDMESLKMAVKGAQRAFLVSTAGTEQQSENEINFIKACQAEGVEFVVRISTCNPLIALESKGVYARAHALIEQYVKENNSPVCDLNPWWFMDNWAAYAQEAKSDGQISLPYGKRPKHGFIHTHDIGGYAAALLTIPSNEISQHIGQHYDICGPQWVTWEYVINALSNEAGYEIKMNDITWQQLAEALKGAGFPDLLATSYALTFAVMEEIQEPKRPKVTATAPVMASLYKPTVTVEEQAKLLAPLFKKDK
jgi:NAD(P)H dehydrogenase (quinone)